MLSFSWINLPNISISGLIKPVQIILIAILPLALLPHSFYVHSILRDRLNMRLADPKLMTFRSPLHLSFGCSQFKKLPCHITATTNVINHFCARYALSATYWSYVKHAALYRTFISQSFVRGNNSNCPVAGHVSGVVVDEGGYAVCLPFVT